MRVHDNLGGVPDNRLLDGAEFALDQGPSLSSNFTLKVMRIAHER
jgi:hypothetical protein